MGGGAIAANVAFVRGPSMPALNTKWCSSTYLAMVFANVRAGTQTRRGVFGYPLEHSRIPWQDTYSSTLLYCVWQAVSGYEVLSRQLNAQ